MLFRSAGIGVLAVASMVGGNLLALLQDSVKRILGASSIAHMGYAMVAFVAGSQASSLGLPFYLVAYFVGMLARLASSRRSAEARGRTGSRTSEGWRRRARGSRRR